MRNRGQQRIAHALGLGRTARRNHLAARARRDRAPPPFARRAYRAACAPPDQAWRLQHRGRRPTTPNAARLVLSGRNNQGPRVGSPYRRPPARRAPTPSVPRSSKPCRALLPAAKLRAAPIRHRREQHHRRPPQAGMDLSDCGLRNVIVGGDARQPAREFVQPPRRPHAAARPAAPARGCAPPWSR